MLLLHHQRMSEDADATYCSYFESSVAVNQLNLDPNGRLSRSLLKVSYSNMDDKLVKHHAATWIYKYMKSGGGGRHCPTKALLLIKRLFHSSMSQKETQILNKQTQRCNFPTLLTALWLFSLFRDASKTASSPPTSPRPGSASGSSTAPASGVVPPRQQKPSSSGATRKKAPQKKKKGGKGGW